jgi:drug/metabolite transporter (DMT)-like permease
MGAEEDKREQSFFAAPKILSMLYFVSGIILIASMNLAGGIPLHLCLVGALNIAVSYSLTKKKRWTFHIVILTSLLGLILGGITLAALIVLFSPDIEEILMLIGILTYIMLSATSLVYVMYKRRMFS